MDKKLPVPPFNLETATQKVQMAEDAWNAKNPEKVSLAYTIDTEWRNRNVFFRGRNQQSIEVDNCAAIAIFTVVSIFETFNLRMLCKNLLNLRFQFSLTQTMNDSEL